MKRVLVSVCVFAGTASAQGVNPLETDVQPARDKPAPVDKPKPVAAADDKADISPVEVSGGLKPTVEISSGPTRARLFGSLGPMVDFKYSPEATEADRLKGGAADSNAGLGLHAQFYNLSGIAYVSVTVPTDQRSLVNLDRATLRWTPLKYLQLSAGHEPIPLDAQAATPMAAMMFPQGLPWHGHFAPVAQAGAQIAGLHEYGSVWLGVWDGFPKDPVSQMMMTEERGLMFSARVEATPLGSFAFDENVKNIPLRIGIGAGATYRAWTSFLPDGEATRRSRDFRAAGSVRVGWSSLLVQAEVMRKQTTDDLTMRPDVATGAYVQGSWRLFAGTWQIVPLFRAGTFTVREMSAPAQGNSLEIGLGTLPLPSDRLRVIGLYQYIGDPDLGPTHRGVAQARLSF